MKTTKQVLFAAIAGLLSAAVAICGYAMTGQKALVIAVHSKESTRVFVDRIGLPTGQSDGGRFAVVKIIDGAYGDASFALVYVPVEMFVAKGDVVDLAPGTVNALANPGKAVVARTASERRGTTVRMAKPGFPVD